MNIDVLDGCTENRGDLSWDGHRRREPHVLQGGKSEERREWMESESGREKKKLPGHMRLWQLLVHRV